MRSPIELGMTVEGGCHSGLDPESKAVDLFRFHGLDPGSGSGRQCVVLLVTTECQINTAYPYISVLYPLTVDSA